MDTLFRLAGAVRRSPIIDAWFAKQAPVLGALARHWYERARECDADVWDVMHDGHPTACVEGAAFCYVGVFSRHVNIGFFHGSELPDPAGLLVGAGKRMRHVTCRPDADVDSKALGDLIAAAHVDIRRRLTAARLESPSVIVNRPDLRPFKEQP